MHNPYFYSYVLSDLRMDGDYLIDYPIFNAVD
jgi:hypothetical protein